MSTGFVAPCQLRPQDDGCRSGSRSGPREMAATRRALLGDESLYSGGSAAKLVRRFMTTMSPAEKIVS